MHLSLLHLSLLLILPLSAAAFPWPPNLRFSKNRLHHSAAESPQEYIQVSHPLPFDSLTPLCTLPLLSHTFDNTIDLLLTNATYFPPPDCTWTNATLQFSAAANGSQYDRIAAVWLAGVELLRTSTPEPTPDGIFWRFRKDVTRYSSLLRQSNITLAVMLENIVNDVYTASFQVNLTLFYYNVRSHATANLAPSLLRPDQKSTTRELKEGFVSANLNKSLELDQNPADLILPISAVGDEGFWFKIQGELDAVYQGIQIPVNTYRAVIEVYVSFHGNDEFWYSNPPDYYIDVNNLTTQRGHGAYREVLVRLDDSVVGSVVPYPVIFPGGINPEFWDPIVSFWVFDLPSYQIELTPFLGMLLDGKVHYFGLGVADAIPYWLVNANLHLWLDDKADKVEAGPIKYEDSDSCVERESKFQQRDGKFEIEGERKSEFSGWVKSSAGNFTTQVTTKFEYENEITFKNNGTKQKVELEVKITNKIEVKDSSSGKQRSNIKSENKYSLEMKTTVLPGSGAENYLMLTELEQSLQEEEKIGKFESKLTNKQESEGWMFVKDDDVLSGSATTTQNYNWKDSSSCYIRKVTAEAGAIDTDSENFLCAAAADAF